MPVRFLGVREDGRPIFQVGSVQEAMDYNARTVAMPNGTMLVDHGLPSSQTYHLVNILGPPSVAAAAPAAIQSHPPVPPPD